MRRAAILPALALIGAAPIAHPRIVSINPCVDAILMRVADPAQIAGVSHYSQDPRATSIPIALANRFVATSGTAEEVVALRPDLVLSSAHVSPATTMALERLHIKLVQYPVPSTVEESEAQVRDVAALVGHRARGEALAEAIGAAARPVAGARIPALIWQAGGLVPGSGTLADELLTRAGFRNVSAGYGLKQWDVLPLEYLIARPPHVLLSVGAAEVGADRITGHPAVARLMKRIVVVPYPTRLLSCGGPTIIAAMERLRAVRQELGAVRQKLGAVRQEVGAVREGVR